VGYTLMWGVGNICCRCPIGSEAWLVGETGPLSVEERRCPCPCHTGAWGNRDWVVITFSHQPGRSPAEECATGTDKVFFLRQLNAQFPFFF